MSSDDIPSSDPLNHLTSISKYTQAYQPHGKETVPVNIRERRFLVYSAVCLSVLGIIAFVITGQVAVVVAMNAPLLTIIGNEFFRR